MVIQSLLARWDPAAFSQMVFVFPSQHPASKAKIGLITAGERGERGEIEVPRS